MGCFPDRLAGQVVSSMSHFMMWPFCRDFALRFPPEEGDIPGSGDASARGQGDEPG